MNKSRSFRARLAWRIAAAVALLLLGTSALACGALRTFLYGRLDDTVLRLAQIEASATADSPDEHVHFHDEVFREGGAGHDAIFARFAQVWTREGVPVLRTANLEPRDLPLPTGTREAVLATNQPTLFSFMWEGKRYRAVLYPLGLIGPAHAPHLLEVAASTDETDLLLRQVLAALAAVVLIGFAGGGALGWWLAGYALRPVLEIIRDAEGFRVADSGHQITAEADTEEMQRLLRVLNAMLVRVDEALESQRRFVADAGHAIKTPLTILRGDLDVALRRDRPAAEYRDTISQALADLRDVSSLAEDLITLARSDSGGIHGQSQIVAVREVVDRVGSRFAGAARGRDMQLHVGGAVNAVVRADPVLLERAIGNLVDNAIKYGRVGGSIRLSVTAEPRVVAVTVEDDGPGIPPADLDRVRERFFRGTLGRATASGSGLGLAIADAIVSATGGQMHLECRDGGGTSVRLEFMHSDVDHGMSDPS